MNRSGCIPPPDRPPDSPNTNPDPIMRIHVSNVARAAACLAAAVCCHNAQAVDFGSGFELHGYGSQDYMQASHNTYLGADNRGTWDNNFLGFVGTVTLNDKSKLWAQLET